MTVLKQREKDDSPMINVFYCSLHVAVVSFFSGSNRRVPVHSI